MENAWLTAGGILVVAAIVAGIFVFRHGRRNKNVVAMDHYKKKAAKGQKCSLCKRKDKLQFYTMGSGKVVGVCKECRPKAQRHSWDRL